MPFKGGKLNKRPVIGFRLSEAQIAEIDKVCQRFGWSHTEFFQNSINILINYYRSQEQ